MEPPQPQSPDEVTEISFIVAESPVPMPRQRHGAIIGGDGKARSVNYTDSKHRVHAYKFAIKQAATEAMGGRPKMAGPLHIGISCVLPRPKSLCRKKDPPGRVPCDKKIGDVDNMAKAVMDACNDLTYLDDAQIWSLFATKEYAAIGEDPHVLVLIREAPHG